MQNQKKSFYQQVHLGFGLCTCMESSDTIYDTRQEYICNLIRTSRNSDISICFRTSDLVNETSLNTSINTSVASKRCGILEFAHILRNEVLPAEYVVFASSYGEKLS